ncbi:MAG: monovalent cation/H(+) antiporter subunit G [Dehalococcoidales bacterium]|nr:monovalent cation/H(+) antiporter subunit G [Dehalococcoidales bacterium]
MIVQTVIAGMFILGGLFFLTVSVTGLIRLPDFYSRNHAVGKSETLGAMLVLCGLAIYNGLDINTLKLLGILLFIALANPTATHIVARAAYRNGLELWVTPKRRSKDTSCPVEPESPQNSTEGKRL